MLIRPLFCLPFMMLLSVSFACSSSGDFDDGKVLLESSHSDAASMSEGDNSLSKQAAKTQIKLVYVTKITSFDVERRTTTSSVTQVPVRILLLVDQDDIMIQQNNSIHSGIIDLGNTLKAEQYKNADIKMAVVSSYYKDKAAKTQEITALDITINTTEMHSANIFATAKKLLETTDQNSVFHNYFSHDRNNIIAVVTEGLDYNDGLKIENPQFENDVITWLKTMDPNLRSFLFYGFLDKKYDQIRQSAVPKTDYHHLAKTLGGKPEEQLFDVIKGPCLSRDNRDLRTNLQCTPRQDNWGDAFSKIKTRVIEKVTKIDSEFYIELPIAEVTEVRKDDTILDPSEYTVRDNHYLKLVSTPNVGAKITVTYKTAKEKE
ncbi:MAG: hypothetical protein OXC40_07335 [Proteobacteria bacterium]|nr:hypothetical protein [Pseudomonadota bacterium]